MDKRRIRTQPNETCSSNHKLLFWTRNLANEAFRKWYHGISIYNRYGLYTDDVANEMDNAHVREAVRRLPAEVYDRRLFRQVRAMQIEINKTYLPKEDWIAYEDPLNHYMQPYIAEVMAEQKEKDEWAKNHPQ